MNLISCNGCGIVYDKDKIVFPNIYDDNTDGIIRENCAWDDSQLRYCAKIKCPVCGEAILDCPRDQL